MGAPQNRWGIAKPTGWWDYEEAILARSRANPPNGLSDNAVSEETLLVDKSGKPLLVRRPRPVGFRIR